MTAGRYTTLEYIFPVTTRPHNGVAMNPTEMNEDRVNELLGAGLVIQANFCAVVEFYRGRVAELEREIGKAPAGSHPDEQKARAATWHAERLNWITEVKQLRTWINVVEKSIRCTTIALRFYAGCDALNDEQQAVARAALASADCVGATDRSASSALARQGRGEEQKG